MSNNIVKVTGGTISQEQAREFEQQQAASLREELKTLSPSRDEQRIRQIRARLKAIEELSKS